MLYIAQLKHCAFDEGEYGFELAGVHGGAGRHLYGFYPALNNADMQHAKRKVLRLKHRTRANVALLHIGVGDFLQNGVDGAQREALALVRLRDRLHMA